MKISELIAELQKAQDAHGDMPIHVEPGLVNSIFLEQVDLIDDNMRRTGDKAVFLDIFTDSECTDEYAGAPDGLD